MIPDKITSIHLLLFLFAIIPVSLSGGNPNSHEIKLPDMESVMTRHILDSTKQKYQEQFQQVKETLVKDYELKHKYSESKK